MVSISGQLFIPYTIMARSQDCITDIVVNNTVVSYNKNVVEPLIIIISEFEFIFCRLCFITSCTA